MGDKMGNLVFSKKNINDTTVLSIGGTIDTGVAPQLEAQLKKAISTGSKKYVGDLTALEHLTSAGIGVLIAVKNEIKSNGGDLKLACVNAKIMKVFSLLNLTKLIQVFPAVEDAMKSF